MKNVRITVMRRSVYPDLMEQYENPLEHPCEMILGDVYVSQNGKRPEGLCGEAWNCMASFVETLAKGGGNFFDGWMKNEKSAMISCNDGFRPVSFLLETLDEDSEQ